MRWHVPFKRKFAPCVFLILVIHSANTYKLLSLHLPWRSGSKMTRLVDTDLGMKGILTHRGQRLTVALYFHLIFWDRIFRWPGSLPVLLDWLASPQDPPVCFLLSPTPRAGITECWHYAWLLKWVQGIQPQGYTSPTDPCLHFRTLLLWPGSLDKTQRIKDHSETLTAAKGKWSGRHWGVCWSMSWVFNFRIYLDLVLVRSRRRGLNSCESPIRFPTFSCNFWGIKWLQIPSHFSQMQFKHPVPSSSVYLFTYFSLLSSYVLCLWCRTA